MFRSQTAADSWWPVGTGLSIFAGQTVAVDPTDPDIAYAGLGNIHRTSDGGVTWTDVSGQLGANIAEIAIDPLSPTVIYVGLSDRLISR